jgi:hypothetical protein
MLETIIVTLFVFLLAAGGLFFGQWFGRKPITGRCSPDNPDCCMSKAGETNCNKVGGR